MSTVSSAAAVEIESDLLEVGRWQSEGAFERVIAPHRAELLAHCYRMLGSPADAEDAVQETLIRAWRAMPTLRTRGALRSWAYRIATNVCLTMIERRPKRMLPMEYGPASEPDEALPPPLVESAWIEPYPDGPFGLEAGANSPEARYERRESVELAFAAALQHLPARQRAVLLLRDVLGFAPAEIATALDVTPTTIYSLLQRARQAVTERLPSRSQQATLRAIGDQRLRRLVERYVDAWDRGDVAAITALLRADATLSMPPRSSWYRGRDDIGAFFVAADVATPGRWRRVPIRVSGQIGFGTYGSCDDGPANVAHAIEVLTLDSKGRIADITSFQAPELFARFGLPNTIGGAR